MKLTPAQLAFLRELATDSQSAHPNYKPAAALAVRGLATCIESSYGNPRYIITELGRQALLTGKVGKHV